MSGAAPESSVKKLRIGVDLGGTKIEFVALEDDGRELQRFRVPTPRGDYDATVKAVRDGALKIEKELQRTATVGVGIPGTISGITRTVKNANSIWMNGKPFDQDLSAALGREVRCANDANCLAVSEATDGSGAGHHIVIAVILGTGCGGGGSSSSAPSNDLKAGTYPFYITATSGQNVQVLQGTLTVQ